jgi:acetoin utilization protein AcuB
MLVEEIMTRQVVTAEPGDSTRMAAHAMREGRFRHLPVVRDGKLVGIISDRDLGRQEEATAGDVMRCQVIRVTAETPVEVAARLMIDNKIGALPVVDHTRETLIGIVSQTDLFDVLARMLAGDSPSTRLELELDDLPRQLADLARSAQRCGVSITSLVTLPHLSGQTDQRRRVVVRVGSMQTRELVAELRGSGLQVDAPRDLADGEVDGITGPADSPR